MHHPTTMQKPTIPTLFTTAVSPWVRRIVLEDREVELPTLSPEQAMQYWRAGATWLHLTPQGAKALLAAMEPEARIPLLAVCKTPLEVEALLQVKPTTPALRAAAKARAAELKGTLPNTDQEPAPAAAAQPRKAVRTAAPPPVPGNEQAHSQAPQAPATTSQPQG